MEVPDAWQNTLDPSYSKKAADSSLPENTQIWWDDFCDDDMEKMIARLIEVNPDLHRARARIEQAFAQRQTHVAGRLPHADFTGRSDTGFAGFDSSGKIHLSDPRSRGKFRQLDAGWELDIFGLHARKIEASDAQARATVEAWRDTLVFLIGEIGIYYTEMRVNEERARISSGFVSVYEEIVRVSKSREEEGAGSALESEKALARLRRQEAEVPEYQRKAAQARNRLAQLLACSSSELSKVISKEAKVLSPPTSIAAGVPADVIRARPDIRAQEDRIEKQVANIGIATTRLYPSLHLSGAITYESIVRGTTRELLRRTIGGGVTGSKRLFHAGADIARVKEEEAILEQTLRSYEATVLTAMNEVENALSDLHYGKIRLTAIEKATAASGSASKRIREAYALGLVDIGELLRVLKEDLDIRTENLFVRNLLSKSCVQLYKATGGGQLPLPPKVTPTNLVGSENVGISRPLSVLFSLGSDRNFTLHRRKIFGGKKKDTPEEELQKAHDQAGASTETSAPSHSD